MFKYLRYRLAIYLQIKNLCDRIKYNFRILDKMPSDSRECIMRHKINGVWYNIVIEESLSQHD